MGPLKMAGCCEAPTAGGAEPVRRAAWLECVGCDRLCVVSGALWSGTERERYGESRKVGTSGSPELQLELELSGRCAKAGRAEAPGTLIAIRGASVILRELGVPLLQCRFQVQQPHVSGGTIDAVCNAPLVGTDVERAKAADICRDGDRRPAGH